MLGRLVEANQLLEEIQKGLNAYLEKKQLFFPRYLYMLYTNTIHHSIFLFSLSLATRVVMWLYLNISKNFHPHYTLCPLHTLSITHFIHYILHSLHTLSIVHFIYHTLSITHFTHYIIYFLHILFIKNFIYCTI